jgi:hypothetical protein
MMETFVHVPISQGRSRPRWIACKLTYEGGQHYALPPPNDDGSLPKKLSLVTGKLAPLHQFPRGVDPHHYQYGEIVLIP